MKNIVLLIKREFRIFWTNKVFAFTFLCMPVILGVVLGNVYIRGKVKQQSIIIVDKDNTPLSDRLSDMLSDNPTLKVMAIKYESIGLHHSMLKDRAVAVVTIPDRFEAEVLTRRHPEINIYLNMSNTLTGGVVSSAISATAATLNAGIAISSLKRKGLPPALAKENYEAMKMNVFQQFNPSGNYLIYLWTGFIFAIMHQLLLLALGSSFSQEYASNQFNEGGLLRYSLSPLILIFVKMIPYLLMSVWTICCYYQLANQFHIPLPTHPLALFVSVLLMVVATSSLAILYSVRNPLPLKATQLLMSLASPAFSLSGFSWPSSQMPEILQWFADIIPLTPFLRAMRMVTVQGANFTDILPHLNHQLIQIAVYLSLSILVLRKQIGIALKQSIIVTK